MTEIFWKLWEPVEMAPDPSIFPLPLLWSLPQAESRWQSMETGRHPPKSGAADCLEALGVNIDLSPEKCVELLKKIGICFFFAAEIPYLHEIRRTGEKRAGGADSL